MSLQEQEGVQGESEVVDYLQIGDAIETVLQRVPAPAPDPDAWFIAKDIIAVKKEGRDAMRFLVTYEG